MTDTPEAEPPVLVDTRDGRMTVTLNRPRALNAHNDAMRLALLDACDRFDDDDDLGVMILRGAGRAFSAGADLKESQPVGPARSVEAIGRKALGIAHFERLEQVRKPTIACLQGYAVGGGLELALCADIRIATVDALLGTPEARTFGGMPMIAVHRLPRLIPAGEAFKILFSSQPISGQRAYDIGLVQELADDVDHMTRLADALADQILECSPVAVRAIKQNARFVLDAATQQSEHYRTYSGSFDGSGADKAQGAAFLAGRKS